MAGGGFVPDPESGKQYPGNLTAYVIVTCVIAAMGGLIFGYDIGISGNFVDLIYGGFYSLCFWDLGFF